MHCSKDKIQCEKERLNKSWDSISNILGTRRFHFLKKINENAIGLYKPFLLILTIMVFDMKSGKFVILSGTSNEQETTVLHETELREGDWVEVVYERNIG